MAMLDFGRSSVRGKSPANAVRFWIESRTRIFDHQAGRSEEYYQSRIVSLPARNRLFAVEV